MTLEIRNDQLIWDGNVIADITFKPGIFQHTHTDIHNYQVAASEDDSYDYEVPENREKYEEVLSEEKASGYIEGFEETINYVKEILQHNNNTMYSDETWCQELGDTMKPDMTFHEERTIDGISIAAVLGDVVYGIVHEELNVDLVDIQRGPYQEIRERDARVAAQKAKEAEKAKSRLATGKCKPKKAAKKTKAKYEKVTFKTHQRDGTHLEETGLRFKYTHQGVDLDLVVHRLGKTRSWSVTHLPSGVMFARYFCMPTGTRSMEAKVNAAKDHLFDRLASISKERLISEFDRHEIINPEFV